MRNRGFFLFLLIVGSVALLGSERERPKELILAPKVPRIKPTAKLAEKSPRLASQQSHPGDYTSANGESQVQLFAQVSPWHLFAQVNRLNMREAPGAHTRSLAAIAVGTRFRVHDTRGSWVRVSREELRLSGWVSRNYLGVSKRSVPKAALTTQQFTKPTAVVLKPAEVSPKITASAARNLDAVVRRIIENSIAGYPGRCPCPYNRDRAGKRCGGRSAYNRAGGFAPLCFPNDVTAELISQYKNIE